jgi:adenosylmethionine---8-amino-7-oxononanoate aminotransferase
LKPALPIGGKDRPIDIPNSNCLQPLHRGLRGRVRSGRPARRHVAEVNVAPADLVARDARVVWHPYTQMLTRPSPLPIVSGEGVYLYTEDGRKLLDGTSSWWVNIHGHSHPRLNEALAVQARRLEHVVFANCTHEPAVELAERLLTVLPRGLTRVFYSDNGSTAVEVALKLACQYWQNRGQPGRRRFVTLHHAYHGDTVGAMSASEDSLFTRAFAPMLFEVSRVHAPYCYRCPMGLARERCHIECLGESAPTSERTGTLQGVLERHHEAVAAVLVEPMLQGAGGMVVWPAEFLAGVRRLCDRYGVLMIADEVLTGFGRTGRLFACEHAAVTPDIICLSKAITGGYLPLGATVATERIYEAFLSEDRTRTFFHGHSFTANPLACAVAVESLKLLHDSDALRKVASLERWLRDGLSPLSTFPLVGDVRVIGGVGIVELVSDKATKTAGGYLDDLGPRLTRAFLDRGLLLRPLGNVLYLMPPYVITEAETSWAIEQIRSVLVDLTRE